MQSSLRLSSCRLSRDRCSLRVARPSTFVCIAARYDSENCNPLAGVRQRRRRVFIIVTTSATCSQCSDNLALATVSEAAGFHNLPVTVLPERQERRQVPTRKRGIGLGNFLQDESLIRCKVLLDTRARERARERSTLQIRVSANAPRCQVRSRVNKAV